MVYTSKGLVTLKLKWYWIPKRMLLQTLTHTRSPYCIAQLMSLEACSITTGRHQCEYIWHTCNVESRIHILVFQVSLLWYINDRCKCETTTRTKAITEVYHPMTPIISLLIELQCDPRMYSALT